MNTTPHGTPDGGTARGPRLRDPAFRVRLARILAVVVDALQIVVLPAFAAGFLAPLNVALDVATGIVMVLLLGWHVAFLPAFLAEWIPFVDLFPTWTVAVLYVTRRSRSAGSAGAGR